MVKKYYSATFHPKVGRLRFVNVPFARQKATLQSIKTGVILNERAHKSKRMLISYGLKAPIINIRYELIFQIEKNFCPDFLLFITQHKSNKANVLCGWKSDTFNKRCPKGLVGNSLQRSNKTNVLADMHVLLSAAKNSTALNIRTNGQRS